MLALEAGYPLDLELTMNLQRWKLEFAVMRGLPAETAAQCMDRGTRARDAALTVLRNPQAHDDEEVFGALTAFMSEKKKQSLPFQEADGRRLLARAWRRFLAVKLENTPFFTACFGRRASIVWHPFSAAIYKSPTPLPDTEYVLNECRSFVRRNGQWKEKCYHTLYRDKNLLDGFIHEGDRLLRAYLGLKHPLKQRPQDLWMTQIFEDVIRAYDSERAEARKPKITIRFDDLERIRRDAIATRDSLLTDEDSAEAPPAIPAHDEAGNAAPRDMGKEAPVSPLSALQVQVLRAILRGESVKDLLRSSHEMPELFADALNEALFDDLSDTAVVCENDDILPVEDYRDDIIRILGGT